MKGPDFLELRGKRGHEPHRKHGHPIAGALAVAHHDLVALQVDVLHAQPAAFEQPQSRAVKQRGHEMLRALEPREHDPYLLSSQHDGYTGRAFRSNQFVEPADVLVENLRVQEQ